MKAGRAITSIALFFAALVFTCPAWSATILVTSSADSGTGSLRASVANAAAGDTIGFTNTLSGRIIRLTSGQITLDKDLTIDASGLPKGIQINGNRASRIFTLTNSATVVLNSLIITNGNSFFEAGGGLYNLGTLLMINCALKGNSAIYGGGGIANLDFATLVMSNCTVAGNSSYYDGGGIYNGDGSSLILNSTTVAGNRTMENGGGIANRGSSLLTVNNSTIANNSATHDEEGSGYGGGIFNSFLSTLTMSHSTVAGNLANDVGGICCGGALTLTNSVVAGNIDRFDSDIFGALDGANNLTTGNPMLAPLGNYGGSTETMPPLFGSPAIDAGDDSTTNSFATDQRGRPRLSGTHVDIGAVEKESFTATRPTMVVSPRSQTVVVGTNLTLTVGALGSDPFRYQWYFNGKAISGATNATFTRTNIQTKKSGAYQVKIRNVFGFARSAVASVKVLPPPGIKTQPKDLAVIEGHRATFTVVVTGARPLRYQWYFDEGFERNKIHGATNAVYTLPSAQPEHMGNYSVEIFNALGQVSSTNASLFVVPFLITEQPRDLTVLRGKKVTFNVRAQSDLPLAYQWFQNGEVLPGATNATFAIPHAMPAHRGNYTVRVVNSLGSLTTTGAALNVIVLPVHITSQPKGVTVKQGGTATFSVLATGSATIGYLWRFAPVPPLGGPPLSEGDLIPGATNATLVITNAQATNAGIYSVYMSNDESYAISSNAVLNIVAPAAVLRESFTDARSAFHALPRLVISTTGAGARRLTILAPAGERCLLEASDDLIAWTPLATVSVEPDTEAVTFIDGDTTTHPQRFYRVTSPLPTTR